MPITDTMLRAELEKMRDDLAVYAVRAERMSGYVENARKSAHILSSVIASLRAQGDYKHADQLREAHKLLWDAFYVAALGLENKG